MLPRETIATAQIPDGKELTLVSHGRDFIIMLGRDELMGTRMQFSEEQLAVLTLAELEASKPRILIGGSLYLAGAVLAENGTPPE